MYDDLEVQYIVKNPYEDIQTTVVALVQPLEEEQNKQISELLGMQIRVQCARLSLELKDLEEELNKRITREKRRKIKTIK